MVDADQLTAVRIGPASDIACSINSRHARLHEPIDHHALVDVNACRFGQLENGRYTNADNDDIGRNRRVIAQLNRAFRDARGRLAQVELHAVILVKLPHELSELSAENALEWHGFRSDHSN